MDNNLFAELEQLGLSQLENVQIYYDNDEAVEEEPLVDKIKLSELDKIYDRSYHCPVCDLSFKSKAIKTGKARLKSIDTDLRPKYYAIDPIKYDAVVCPHCGYGALNRFFNQITSSQARWVQEQISNKFRGLSDDIELYDYDEALKRYKLALVNAIVKKGKKSEKAYICLKISWLLRGKREQLSKKDITIERGLKNQELEFTKYAYEGFVQSFAKELFPICGMDEITVTYLVGELGRRIGKDDEALKWLSKVIGSRIANERIKDRAREIKNIIRDKKKRNNA